MTLKVSITCFDGGIMDMIRDNRVMWLCKVRAKGGLGWMAVQSLFQGWDGDRGLAEQGHTCGDTEFA